MAANVAQLRRRFGSAAAIFATTFVVGVIGYRIIGGEESGWMEAVYMTANVLSTVGFREAIPVDGNTTAMLFTIALLFFGAGALVYATSVITAFIVEGDLTEGFRSRRMQRAIRDMRNHYIVCGMGATGLAVLRELVHTERPAVAIETNEERLQKVQQEFPDVPVLKEDFTDDAVLMRAGVARAAGMVLCTTVAKDSLVATITARQLNANIRIIARALDERAMERLKHAGVDAVVSPALIGGMRMASELVRPAVVSFLDKMLKNRDRNLRVEEVTVPANSPFVGRPIDDLHAHARTNCLVLALRRDHTDLYNPPDATPLAGDDVLIVMGDPPGVRALQQWCETGAGAKTA